MGEREAELSSIRSAGSRGQEQIEALQRVVGAEGKLHHLTT